MKLMAIPTLYTRNNGGQVYLRNNFQFKIYYAETVVRVEDMAGVGVCKGGRYRA